MPVNKDAMGRYRIIDRMLADPQKDYTTGEIWQAVSRECPSVSIRMIQKDIKALEEELGKKILRGAAGKGTVRYADQADPIFYQELTGDEEEILREAIASLGQFEGLENFKWLETLKRKLDVRQEKKERPIISFSRTNVLQIPDNLLGQLFSAISRRKVIRFGYRRFQDADKPYSPTTVHPYQLRQHNNRWFLICNPIGSKNHPFVPDGIYNYALDRMNGKVEYMEDIPYIDTPVDIDALFEDIVGVTLKKGVEMEDIYFAVKPQAVDYIRTKFIHPSQDEVNPSVEREFKKKYPTLSDCRFFVISCRPNNELITAMASFGGSVIVVEPQKIRDELKEIFRRAGANYEALG
ncbi:MAG: WYL domain-containing protein [Bacteroidales bacterium]|nr:WYL domain-containing protein [Bacteroidales bacterium]